MCVRLENVGKVISILLPPYYIYYSFPCQLQTWKEKYFQSFFGSNPWRKGTNDCNIVKPVLETPVMTPPESRDDPGIADTHSGINRQSSQSMRVHHQRLLSRRHEFCVEIFLVRVVKGLVGSKVARRRGSRKNGNSNAWHVRNDSAERLMTVHQRRQSLARFSIQVGDCWTGRL